MEELYLDLGFVTRGEGGKISSNRNHVLKPPYDQLFMRGKWIPDAFEEKGVDKLPIPERAKDDFWRLIEDLERLYEWRDKQGKGAFDCPPDLSSKDEKMRALDSMTLGEYAKSKGWSSTMIKLFDPLLKSAYGLGEDRISAWAALDILMDELLEADAGEEALGFPGGNAYFAEKIAETIPGGKIRTDTMVTKLKNTGGGVLVTALQNGVERTLRARTVIFAAQYFTAPYLIENLSGDKAKAAKDFEYAAYVVANVAVSRTPEALAYSNQLHGDFVMSDFIVADWTTWADPAKADPGRANVMTAYCPLERQDRKVLLSPSVSAWESRILNEFEYCLPGFKKTVTAFHLHRWGHAFAVPAKGKLFSKERLLAKEKFGRIVFACADTEGIPTIDHAMAAGFRAAWEIEELLG